MPSRQLNRFLWLAVLSVLAVLVYQFDLRPFLGNGKLTVEKDAADARIVILRWRGSIEQPMLAKLKDAVAEHRNGADRFVLSLSSPGGSVGHGGAVIRLLRDLKRSHHLETVLESGATCASMCVPVYLQGETRRANPRSRWMFHDVSFRDAVTNEKEDGRQSDSKARTDRLFDDYFRPAGVSEDWIRDMRLAMKKGDVWRSGEDLLRDRAGIILERQ
jgi:hypothetical protein